MSMKRRYGVLLLLTREHLKTNTVASTQDNTDEGYLNSLAEIEVLARDLRILATCIGQDVSSAAMAAGDGLKVFGPYLALLLRSRGDLVSIASATALFVQTAKVQVSVGQVVEYYKSAPTGVDGMSIVGQAGSPIGVFTTAITLMSDAIFGTTTAEVVRASPLWGAAMRLAHWLILGPLYFICGGEKVSALVEWYERWFPTTSGVTVAHSIAAVVRAFWEHGLALVTGKVSLAQLFQQDDTLSWFNECADVVANSSSYEWLQGHGFVSGETESLTVEFEQYLGSLISRGARLRSIDAGPLTAKSIDMDKSLKMLAAKVRALRSGMESKEQPVCILLFSAPGCQKSTYQKLIMRMVWDVIYPGQAFDKSLVAEVSTSAARLDNVNGQTRILSIDDAGQYFVSLQKNPLASNPMAFVNCVPTMLDQAEISRKGTEMMNHKAVLINTNTRSLQILETNTVPAAAFRRIWRCLTISPRGEKAVGNHAAGRLLPAEELNTMYDFTVERYEARGNEVVVVNDFSGRVVTQITKGTNSEIVDIQAGERRTFAQCVAHLRGGLIRYFEVQRAVMGQKAEFMMAPLCETCGNIPSLCVGHMLPLEGAPGVEAIMRPLGGSLEEEVGGPAEGIGPQSGRTTLAVAAMLGIMVYGALALTHDVYKAFGATRRTTVRATDAITRVGDAADSIASLATAAAQTVADARLEVEATRERWRSAALRAMTNSARVLLAASLVGGLAFAAARIYRHLVPQSGALELLASIGSVPGVQTADWPKGHYTPYVVPPMSANALKSAVPMNQAISKEAKIRNNMVHVTLLLNGQGEAQTMYGLMIQSSYMLTVFHPYADREGQYLVHIVGRPEAKQSQTRTISLDMQHDVFRVPDTDYCVIAVGASAYPNILHMFPPTVGKELEGAVTAWRFNSGTFEEETLTSHLCLETRPNAMGIRAAGYSYTAVAPYGAGTCGTVLISSHLGGPYIVGLHSLGQPKGSYGWSEGLTQGPLAATLVRMRDSSSLHVAGVESGLISALADSSMSCDHPHVKTIFPHVSGFCRYWANVRALRTTATKSAFETTPLYDEITEATALDLAVPNLLPGINGEGEYVDPLLSAAVSNSTPPGAFNQELLRLCFRNYLEGMGALDWTKTGYLSLHQALNGIPGEVGSVNLSAGAGVFIGRKKRDHVTGPVGDLVLSSVVSGQLAETFAAWSRQESVHFVYSMTTKDEPRKPGKTPRVFSAGNFVETLVTRMCFGGFFEFVKKHRGLTEHAVGINCGNSDEWTAVVDKLGGLDALVLALDAKKFDFSNQLAPYVLILLAQFLGRTFPGHAFSHYALCCAREHLVYYRSYRGEIVFQTPNQPSGTSFTAEINSMCTSIYERMYFYSCARAEFPEAEWHDIFARYDFNECIAMLNYGDDFLLSVKKEIPWYTLEGRAAAAEMLGMDYSMPDKKSEARFVRLRDAEFLKRGFEVHNGLMCAPLEWTSIFKALAFYRNNSALSRKQAMAEAAKNAIVQLYMHGEEKYNLGVAQIGGLLESLRGSADYGNVYDDVFPLRPKELTYEQLLTAHRAGAYNELATGV